MTTGRFRARAFPPSVEVGPSPRTRALEALAVEAWWAQALAEAGGDVAQAVAAVLRERDDPIQQLAAVELGRLHPRSR